MLGFTRRWIDWGGTQDSKMEPLNVTCYSGTFFIHPLQAFNLKKSLVMKRNTFFMAAALAIAILSACNSGDNKNTTDSTTTTTSTAQTGGTTTTTTRQINFDPSASYVDISGKSMKLRVDTVHHYVVEEVTNQPVTFYINPATHDTFDQSGRVVTGALVKGDNGQYSVDESRITSTGDDMSTGTTTTQSSTTPTTDMSDVDKMKMKSKTDSGTTKVKVKDDKIKIKQKQ